ncbi:hypothetical protein SHIRM173S_06062 [Streptomyces hirsutus]
MGRPLVQGPLLTLPGATGAPAADTATGRLLPLGIDVQEHATAVQAQVHAVFEPADGGAPRLVRAAASAPKPDTVVGAGLWQLLRPHLSLLTAVSEGRAMDLDAMPVTAEGDLIWDDARARTGEPADCLATARVALPTAAAAATAPLDRHPARIAAPVLLEGYEAEQDDDGVAFRIAGHRLPVDTDRIPAAGPLTAEAVAASGACIALLRWDAGEFHVQPLAVERTVRKKAVAVHAGAWAGGHHRRPARPTPRPRPHLGAPPPPPPIPVRAPPPPAPRGRGLAAFRGRAPQPPPAPSPPPRETSPGRGWRAETATTSSSPSPASRSSPPPTAATAGSTTSRPR